MILSSYKLTILLVLIFIISPYGGSDGGFSAAFGASINSSGGEFKFTRNYYNGSVPENSMGSTMVVPTEKMGIWNSPNRTVHYRITAGDSHKLFRVESRQVGDFCFLIIRVNNNERSLNREMREIYKIQIRGEIFASDSESSESDQTTYNNLQLNDDHTTSEKSSSINPQNFVPEFIVVDGSKSASSRLIDIDDGENEIVSTKDSKILEKELFQKSSKSVQNDHSSSSRHKIHLAFPEGPAEFVEDISPSDKKSSSSLSDGSSSSTIIKDGKSRGNGPKSSLKRNSRDETTRKSQSKSRTRNRSGERRKSRKEKQTEIPNLVTPPMTIPSPTPPTSSRNSAAKTVLFATDTIVFIRIIDKNDNEPIFLNTNDVIVSQDAPVLSYVAKINAVDADIGRNREIYYSLPKWSETWTIDPITGFVSPVRPLTYPGSRGLERDRETLQVRAKNRWNFGKSSGGSLTNVNIHVRPVNRYSPQISAIELPKVEIRPYGVIYSVVTVRDQDEGENGLVDLEIVEGDPNGVFRVTPAKSSQRNEFYIEMSPIVAQSLQRNAENGESSFNLTLRASDRGVPTKSSEKELEVFVANSLWPDKSLYSSIFDKDVYEVEISEMSPPHTAVFRLKRPHPKVLLSISSGNEGDEFILEEKSGVLYTAKWLDTEIKSTYTLTLDSHDLRTGRFLTGVRRQTVAKVVVKILDANDNEPVFDMVYSSNNLTNKYHLMENEPVGTKIAKFTARDQDQGENGYVTYNIANLQPTPFSIDHFTGELRTTEKLDYETSRHSYELIIRASDWGVPSRRESQMIIHIKLDNSNDNRPLFTVERCQALIDRNIKFETEFGKLTAIDFDRNVVTYRIAGGNEDGCFGLDSTSGKLRVMCDMRDHRVFKRFLNVTATDGEYFSDIITVKVELSDGLRSTFNDKSESVKKGIKLFSTSQSVFECTDTGVEERFERMLATSDENNKDIEDSGSYAPLPSRYGENVHIPQFVDFPNEITVNESKSVGSSVLVIKGRDLDKGYNGLLTFVISGGDDHGVWDIVNPHSSTVSQEANLVLALPLKREEVSNFLLNISVWDQGKPPKQTSRLLPIKVNNNVNTPPIFLRPVIKIKFGEGDKLIGETLVQVIAIDKDEPGTSNSEISYRLLNQVSEFSIDEKNGKIKLMAELDRERQGRYELLVMAEDNGSPKKLSSIAMVTIIVEDRNDVVPRFESYGSGQKNGGRIFKIPEDYPVGALVTRILAIDEDLNEAGIVRYTLISEGRSADNDFALDEISGVLRVRNELDYEKTSLYNLTIRARDLGSPSLSSESFVVIEILDVNEEENMLSFDDIVIVASIPENAHVGSLVSQIIPNLSTNSLYSMGGLSYSLEGKSAYLFTINNQGELRTGHFLDYEKQSSHWLTVIARNGLNVNNVARLEVYVELQDVNDFVPLTVKPQYSVQVVENTPAGHLVLRLEAFDYDGSDQNGAYRFYFKSSTPYFTIDEENGEIRTSKVPLDREVLAEHSLEVVVIDKGSPPLNSTTSVLVKVLDLNDESSVFLFPTGVVHLIPELGVEEQGDEPNDDEDNLIEKYDNEELEDSLKWSDWQVMDETLEGIVALKKIFRVVAVDQDEGDNGTVRYRLKYPTNAVDHSGETPDVFLIHPISGDIYTSANTIKSDTILKFVIEARDLGSPRSLRTESYLTLRVKGLEKSPNKPVVGPNLEISLSTKEKPGYTVETIEAYDPDGDDQLWYSIVSGDPGQYFLLKPDSRNLILARPLPSGQIFRLNISVSDGFNTVYTKLIIRVIESERRVPLTWEKPNYTIHAHEFTTESSPIVTVRVNRSSSPTNSLSTPIFYGFHNAQDVRSLKLFTIDPLSGEVFVSKSGQIDRESLPRHLLTVKAWSPVELYSSFVRLNIEIEDSNDHVPMFHDSNPGQGVSRKEVRIPETTAVGALIAQVEAFDLDSGENGRITYSITFGNIGNTFGLERESGRLYLNRQLNLPYSDTSMEYQLTIKASDHGSPPLFSNTILTVIVTLASDEEMLAMRCGSDDELTLVGSIGIGTRNDNKKPGSLSGSSSHGETRVRVKENATPGSYVTSVRVVNSASVNYEIEDNRNNMFWIDPATGIILVGKNKGLLDREKRPSHEISVRATNSRGVTATCRVLIELEDENDNYPIFTHITYHGKIAEDAPLGSLVMLIPQTSSLTSFSPPGTSKNEPVIEQPNEPLVLHSTDADSGINALVTYSIIEDSEMRTVFHIDPSTGALLLVTSLDFEKRSSYIFHVRAVDGGGLSSPNVAIVNVTVLNVNDRAPNVKSARVNLFTPTLFGVLVHVVEAFDADGDELEFNISRGNLQKYFTIDRKTGEIRIQKTEGLSGGKYVLEIGVFDGRFTTVATINIHLKPVEKNQFFDFRNETFHTSLMENSTKILNLISLMVKGARINEHLHFEILNPTPFFKIKQTSGIVYTTGKKLDRETESRHTLLVEVRGDEVSRRARCFVEIQVLDINDNCPVFLQLPLIAIVSLDARPGDFVIQVKAFDADEGENSMIRYELVRSPYGDIYDLDKKSGEILMRRKPDSIGHHEITIKAYDGGVPTCTSHTTIQIKIVTHDQPVFEQQWYETWIPENAALHSTVLALVAHAKNPILYSIESGNDFDEFAIDYQTELSLNRICILFVNSPLDFETQSIHRLTVRATDLVNSAWSSTVINIRIVDGNDNTPRFEKSSYTIKISENYFPPKGIVSVLKAHDNDTGNNALLTYEMVVDKSKMMRIPRDLLDDMDEEEMEEIMKEDAKSFNKSYHDPSKWFMIRNDGSIMLKHTLDYERASEYRFSVVVKDSGIPSLSSTARVIVEVTNRVDNPPILSKNYEIIKISESVPRNHFVAKITAYDPDNMDSLRYTIIGLYHHKSAFDINEKSGIVTISQPKVLLTELNFDLNISVSNGVFTSYTRLQIEVEPRNHHIPSFSSLIYEVGCMENSPAGHLIATLKAEDSDRGIFGKVKYSLVDTDEPGLFTVDEDSGQVRLSSNSEFSLDREYKNSHSLDIMAQDGGGWVGYTKLVVKLGDKNEYSPEFPVSEYRITLPRERMKSRAPILQVVAVDADTEFGIRYSIVDLPNKPLQGKNASNLIKRDSMHFEIHGDTGEIRFKLTEDDILKFKTTDRLDFQIWAAATDEGGLSSHVPITVVILPDGTPTPELQPQNATFFVKEDAPVGSLVTTFRVTNMEDPRFRVVSSNNEYFHVDREGNLLISARLDQEPEDKYTVVLWAESSDGMAVATSQVTIRLLVINNSSPKFNSPRYSLKIAEDFPEGSLLLTVRAVDAQNHNGNGKERYSLVSSTMDMMHFSVNPEHGWITLVNKLDYEMNKVHELHVVAIDSEKPHLSSTATILIDVLNINNQKVLFDTGHYYSSVSEDVGEGYIVATVKTTDLDDVKRTNSVPSSASITPLYLAYYIVNGNEKGHFKINERGEISVWRTIDAERDQNFELRIIATDGLFIDYANVSINILDVNDNLPICPDPEYMKSLLESSPIGTYVTTVQAHDPDISSSTPIYFLSGHGADDFDVENGVIITKRRLDREGIFGSQYKLTVHARESNEECTSLLIIKVLDTNDEEPVFSEKSYMVAVKEDAPLGALVGKVSAEDKDEGINRKLKYSLFSTYTVGGTFVDDQFAVDPSSGVISLLRPLDRELVTQYNLTIQAADGGTPSLSTKTSVTINIVDVNDNPPEFAFNYYSSSISELASEGTEVVKVLASSKDEGPNALIDYDIVGGNGYGHFGINPKTGAIFINSSLDYERVREYVISVRAKDNGTPPLASQCLVNISILDTNDNTPMFTQNSYSVQILEDAGINASVMLLIASDLDSGENSVITYELMGGDRMKQFQIDPKTGILTVASVLDREMISHYALEIWASDHGFPSLSSSTVVEVDILDVNDSPPVFTKENYTAIVQEDRMIGYVVLTFSVSDADSYPNGGPFTWDLRDTEKGTPLPFTVSDDGKLLVAGKLNFQRKSIYRLQVRVFDNSDSPLYSDTNVTIKVVDKSQWPPVVSTLTITAITADDSYSAGVPLGRVYASDFDPYDILVYSLLETQSSRLFTIDSQNGTLKALTALREGTYELGIAVSDGRWTARGDVYLKILTLNGLLPDIKQDPSITQQEDGGKMLQGKIQKDISSLAVVMTLRGHSPQSLLSRIFALINAVKEAMGVEPSGISAYEVVVLSVQSSKLIDNFDDDLQELNELSPSAPKKRKREAPIQQVPVVDILIAVRRSSDGIFVHPSELVKKLRFALPQLESVLGAKVIQLTYDICKDDSCSRGQCRTVASFEGTQSLITMEILSLITPNHQLETICICNPGFGGPKCENVINACAESECLPGYLCVPDASPKGYACLCRKAYCSQDGNICEDHCSQQPVNFSGTSFLGYNVGTSLERELSVSLRIKTQYTSGTLLYTYGQYDFALLEIRQGLVQFSWDLGTGKEVLTVTSISVSDNRWHRITLQLKDNYAILRVDERSTQRQKSPGPARSLHTGPIAIGARLIGSSGSPLETLIPTQGFIGCMKDLRFGYLTENKSSETLHIQEVKHYISTGPGIKNIPDGGFFKPDGTGEDEDDEIFDPPNQNTNRMTPLPLHTSDKEKSLTAHLIWSRNISFSCEKFVPVIEACRSLPCLNGGICSSDRNPNGYKCQCQSRFHGMNCEIDLDPCGSQPCLNGGKCMPTTPNGISFSPSLVSGGDNQEPQFYCHCVEGTFGYRCERGRWCHNSNHNGQIGDSDSDSVCHHRGECEDGPIGPLCWCEKGYTGANCQLDLNECEKKDICGPGSTCLNYEGGFRCLCPANATGLRCNRLLTTPSIIASDYHEVILIVCIVLTFIILLILFVFVRRCLIARDRNPGSNAIPLTSSHLKDNKDNRQIGRDNRDQILRNRDSKISNLEVRPVSTGSDLFATDLRSSLDPIKSYGSAGDDLEKPPPFINNLMKGTKDNKKMFGTSWEANTSRETNRDDYPKLQNYIKTEINWASKGSKGNSSGQSSGYHWDHCDLPQPANISPTRTLPPPPDLPDSLSLVSHDSNNDIHTINLAALPPIDSTIRDMDTLVEEDDNSSANRHRLNGNTSGGGSELDEGTSCDDENTWPILHPDQYLLPHRISEGTSEGTGTDPDENNKPDSQTPMMAQNQQSSNQKPLAIRNRYRKKSPGCAYARGSPMPPHSTISEISDDEINENSTLLGNDESEQIKPMPLIYPAATATINKKTSLPPKKVTIAENNSRAIVGNNSRNGGSYKEPSLGSKLNGGNNHSSSENVTRNKNLNKSTHITQV